MAALKWLITVSPLLVLTVLISITFYPVNADVYYIGWGHYAGLVVVILSWILRFVNYRSFLIVLGIGLALGGANIFRYYYVQYGFSFGYGDGGGNSSTGANPRMALLLVLHYFANRKGWDSIFQSIKDWYEEP